MTIQLPRYRQLFIGLVLVVTVFATITIIVATTQSPARPSIARPNSEYRATSPGSLLTQVSLGPGTQLMAVDMRSIKFGFGVARTNDAGPNPDYLVTTHDGARNWHVVRRMFLTVGAPANNVEQNPTLLSFLSSSIGYVSTSNGIDVTTNGGRTWAPINLGAPVLDWRANSDGLVAITRPCTQGCPLDIVTAPLGSVTLRPLAVHLPVRFSDERVSTMALEGQGVLVLTGSPAVPSGDPRLWTVSGGRLTSTTDPCHSLQLEGYVTTQLVVGHAGSYLYCFADVGMNQGYNELWHQDRISNSWSLRQKVSPFSSAGQKSLGDSPFLLGLVDGGYRLMAISEGAYTEMVVSSDGGRTWSRTPSASLVTQGGEPMSASPWGGGAMLLSNEGALFATRDGRHIFRYSLPTGVSSKIAWCSPPRTSVNLGPSAGPFGDYVVTIQSQVAPGPSTCAFRGRLFIEFTASPRGDGSAKLLAAPSRLTPWPTHFVLGASSVLVVKVRIASGGSSCAPTFVRRIILDVGPERFLAWDTSRPSLGICIRQPVIEVGKPYVFRTR